MLNTGHNEAVNVLLSKKGKSNWQGFPPAGGHLCGAVQGE